MAAPLKPKHSHRLKRKVHTVRAKFATEARDLLEIAESRYKNASTIFCSQFAVAGWREKIGDPILADAICDRIVHESYQVVIDCKESMRKRKGVKERGD